MEANLKGRAARVLLAAALACGLMVPTGAFAAEEPGDGEGRADTAAGQSEGLSPTDFDSALSDAERSEPEAEQPSQETSPAASEAHDTTGDETDKGGAAKTPAARIAQEVFATAGAVAGIETPRAQSDALASSSPRDWSAAAAAGDLQVLGGASGKDWRIEGGVLHIMSSSPLVVRNDPGKAQSSTKITVDVGVKAELTLDNVNIRVSSGCPIDILTNLYGTADKSMATTGDKIIDKTSLYLKVADGSVNTLYTSDGNGAGIHCGEGSELVIDDERDNRSADGTMASAIGAKVAKAITLKDGTSLAAGEPSYRLDSDSPGKLNVTGGLRAAGIGSTVLENGGTMTFNGGNLKVDVQNAYGSEGDATSLSAGIGAGAEGDGTTSLITFNGGTIWSHGGVHGAGIGAAHAGHDVSTGTVRSDIIRTRHTTQASNVAGDILINGGFITSIGGAHGGAFGSACWSSNQGHTITVTGGTLIPVAGKGSGGTHAHGSYFPEIGGYGGHVVITGGSVRCSNPALYFQGVGGTAWGSTDYSKETNKVTMVAIDLSEELRQNNKLEGIEDNELNSLIESWDLFVGSEPYTYGAPVNFDNGKLYLWLPKSATEKQISVTLKYEDKNGKVHEVLPLFREPDQKGELLKRYLDFEITDPDYQTSLVKYYDGTSLPAYDLSAPGKSITTPAPDNKILNQTVDSTGNRLIQYLYQPFDKTPSDSGAAEPQPTGPETSQTETDGAGHTFTVLPSNAGAVKLTMISKQYADEKSSDDVIKEFAKSYWGHRAFLWGKILPIVSQVRDLTAEWDEETDTTQKPGENAHPSDHVLRVSASIERAETVDGSPKKADESNATKPTCKAPEGRVQLYVDKEPVGSPIELRFEDVRDSAGKVIFPANAQRRGDDATGHYTYFSYAFKPSETDHLVPKVGDEGRHEISLKFLPPNDEQVKAGTPANYLESVDPAKDPENAPMAEVAIDPIDPKPTVNSESDPENNDPQAPQPTVTTDKDPKPTDPGADPSKPGDKTYGGTITTTWDEPSADNPNPGRVIMKVKTPSTGAIAVTDEDGELYEVEFVCDKNGEPVRNDDGTYTLVLDPQKVGSGKLTFSQAPNGAYTGTTWVYKVDVNPNPKIPPETSVSKSAENLTSPGKPVQPGDRVRYRIEAKNAAAGSAWNNVAISDPLPSCLDATGLTVHLTNGTEHFDGALTATDGAAGLGTYALSVPNDEGRRTLSAPAGRIYGAGTAVLTIEGTVKADAAGQGISSSLENIASATGTRPDPANPAAEIPENPGPSDPATPSASPTVAPADPKVRIAKTVENLTTPGAKVTRKGDTLRYRIELANEGAANSCLVRAIVSDPLPTGLEPKPGSLKMMFADGTEAPVDDVAYDRASRTIAVSAGDLWGGQAVSLSFNVTVGDEALGANNANIAMAHGTIPSKGPDSTPENPDPGKPADPPTGEPAAFTPPVLPPVLVGDDPAENDVKLSKKADNLTRDDGKTRVGDKIRYTIVLRNDGAGTAWMDAVVIDEIPEGIEPVSGTIEITFPTGKTTSMDDSAYDAPTRILAVPAGHLYGGQAVTVTFTALVTERAMDRDIGNVAEAVGDLPSKWDPDGEHPEAGKPFSPPGSWIDYMRGRPTVESEKAYPPGTNEKGGVLPGEADDSTTIRKKRLAQTGDEMLAVSIVGAAIAAGAAAIALLARRRASRAR